MLKVVDFGNYSIIKNHITKYCTVLYSNTDFEKKYNFNLLDFRLLKSMHLRVKVEFEFLFCWMN